MKVIIDVMSGDNAPLELVKGAVMAKENLGVDIVAVGNEEIIRKIASEQSLNIDSIEIVNTDVVIDMEDDAVSVVRAKKDSSMGIGLQMLSRGEGDAFVSAGNTGALLTGATLIVRRIKGIKRAAIATVLPLQTPTLLIDSGANIEVDEKILEQFAVMGSVYMEKIYGIDTARVGLLNNGTESTKGTALYKNANQLLGASADINFVGNVEAKEVPFGACDVLVCDGFTGNVLLKSIEGMSKFFMRTLKNVFYENLFTKLSALMLKGKIGGIKKQFDASEHGGAPFLGIAKPVIKAHGSSDARAVMNAVRQAVSYAKTGIIDNISECALRIKEREDTKE
ncbi:MAG: phosphate acyltransferase PlsX [Clostridia bacterium]|nr:phosphate acyltransferase PlsX [Clostridia bacterium]